MFVQNIGTNAGLDFDIKNDKIASRLICHRENGELIYADSEFENMCSSLSTDPIGIENINIQAYPNPFNSSLMLKLDFEGQEKIDVYNSNGQLLFSNLTNDIKAEIEFSDKLISTLYLVKITTEYGVVTKKVLRFAD